MSEGLKELKRLPKAIKDTFKDSFNIIEKELKDKEKFEELVNMDLDLFMKAVDIKGLIADYQKFKKALEIIKEKEVDISIFKSYLKCGVGLKDFTYQEYKKYNHSIFSKIKLTQEEYDLLKEIFKS